MKKNKILKLLVFQIILLIVVIFTANYVVTANAKNKTYDSVNDVPKNKVGLLLGTVKYLSNGQINLYYLHRVDAAVALYKAGKINVVLISGDNGSVKYDEPTAFKKDLIAKGIPEDSIYLDYAGFRTLDSVVRAKEIFGQQEYTVISQAFHNQRAIYLAECFKLKVVGFNATDVSGKLSFRVKVREYFARVKVFIDVLTGKKPKFLGEKIEIK